MDSINFNNSIYGKKFEIINNDYLHKLSQEKLKVINSVIIRYKKNSDNEYYIILFLIHVLVRDGVIEETHSLVTKIDRVNMAKIIKAFEYEENGDCENYLKEIMSLNKDLFTLKIIMKYTLLLDNNLCEKTIKNKKNYYSAMGYIIPYLTFTQSPYLGFFQDIYFMNLYPEDYKKIKKNHLEKLHEIELPGDYIIGIINDLSNALSKSRVTGNIKVRKKTYFSLYNKIRRKNEVGISDSIGIRIIFRNMADLNSFIETFESMYVYSKKKDYINSPKKNGYKSIHYTLISPFINTQVPIELQLRTKKMDTNVQSIEDLSHYNYTVEQNKWAPLFKEVHKGYEIMDKIIKKK